jgi:hypothetical protein
MAVDEEGQSAKHAYFGKALFAVKDLAETVGEGFVVGHGASIPPQFASAAVTPQARRRLIRDRQSQRRSVPAVHVEADGERLTLCARF